MACIVLFFPSVICTMIIYKICWGGSTSNRIKILATYLISVLSINFLDILVVTYIFQNPGDIIEKINTSSNFAIKYIVLSCVFSVIIPFAFKIINNSQITVKITKKITSKAWRIMALIYTIVLFAFNFIRIFDNNFWGDESYTIRLAKETVAQMIQATAADVHPPLYYIFQIGAFRLFGEQGWVFHFVSLVPYILILVFALTIIWKKFGKIPAVLIVTFSSLLSNAVTYNVEARMYSWAAFFMLVAFYSLYGILEKEEIHSFIVFVVSSLGAAYTHYYALLSVAILYIGLIVWFIVKKKKIWKVLIVYLASIIGYLPWAIQLFKAFKRTTEEFWIERSPRWKSCFKFFFATDKPWYSYVIVLLTIIAVVLFALLDTKVISINKEGKIFQLEISKPHKPMSEISYWMICGLSSAIATIFIGKLVSNLFRPMLVTRYLYPVAIIFWLVSAMILSKIKYKKSVAIIVLVVTLIVCIPMDINIYRNEKAENIECQETIDFIEKNIKKTDYILTNGKHLDWTILDYYMPQNPHRLANIDFNKFEKNKNYWLVWNCDLSEEEMDWLKTNGYNAIEEYHGGVIGCNDVNIYYLSDKGGIK